MTTTEDDPLWVHPEKWSVYRPPVYAWRCELFGCGPQLVLQREEGKQPRWFWRQMQWLILGNKWGRIIPKENCGE